MKGSEKFRFDPAVPRAALELRIILLLVLFLSSSAILHAQTPKKVPFPFSPIGINSLPWLIAKEARIPEKHGIDFDPVFIGSSAVLFQSMLSGAANFAGSGGPAVISNVLRGGDIIQITAMVPRFTQSVIVKPEIRKSEDMVGKKIGVSRLGHRYPLRAANGDRKPRLKRGNHPATGRATRGIGRSGARLGGRRGVFAALQLPIEEAGLS